MTDQVRERGGALVGWTSQDLGTSLVLNLQTFERTGHERGEHPDNTHVLMTRNQAIVLANYLLKIAGAPPPPKKPGWFGQRFG